MDSITRQHAGIPVVIDIKPKIAHNKIMIFDQTAVFTGSFNFSQSAQNSHAENGSIISGDTDLIQAILDNGETCFKLSRDYGHPALNDRDNNPDD